MKKNLGTLLFILMLFMSCNLIQSNGKYSGFSKVINIKNIVPVSGESECKIINLRIPPPEEATFDYNKYLKNIRFVKLETTPNSVIGDIDKIFFAKNRIIIGDFRITQSVYIFDSSGHFINKISCNKEATNGPNDLSSFLDVAFYYNTDEIILHDDKKSESYYFDSNGTFKRIEKEYVSFYNFNNIKGTNYFVYLDLYTQNTHIPILTKSDIYLGRANTQIMYTAPKAIQRVKIRSNYHYDYNLSSDNSNNKIFYTPVFSDTIYEIDGNKLNVYPKFVLHFPGNEIINKVKENPQIGIEQFTKLLNTHQYYCFQGRILSCGDSTFYIECNKNNQYGYFFSERTNKIIGGNIFSRLAKKDSAQIDFYSYPIATFNNKFVSILSPKDFINLTNGLWSEAFSKVVKESSPKDNPILAFYELKKF